MFRSKIKCNQFFIKIFINIILFQFLSTLNPTNISKIYFIIIIIHFFKYIYQKYSTQQKKKESCWNQQKTHAEQEIDNELCVLLSKSSMCV